jgi:hypothetical protein
MYDINDESDDSITPLERLPRLPLPNQNRVNVQKRNPQSRTAKAARMPNSSRTRSRTSGARPIPGMPADLFYNTKHPSTFSAMDLAKFKRYNNNISRHKQFKAKFKRNNVIAPGLYTFLFADTIHAYRDTKKNQPSKINGGYQYILVVVDALSRQSFVRPLFTTTAKECAAAFEDICLYLDLPGSPFLVTDQGPEFSTQFDRAIKNWGFQRIRLETRHKAMMAERFM